MPNGSGSRSGDGADVAVVFVSHRLEDSVLARFHALERELPSGMDPLFAYDATEADSPALDRATDDVGESLVTYDRSTVLDVDYPDPFADSSQRSIVPGNVDLIFLHLARRHPGYDRYWFVEYDVAFTGNWDRFFGAFTDSEADLLGTTITPYSSRPDWYWREAMETVPALPDDAKIRGFFPILRLSSAALERLDAAYRRGWSGHYESVLPTLLNHHGMTIEDVGGDGPYVAEGNRNRFYTNTPDHFTLSPGTFIYRPGRPRPGLHREKLYHPIKPDAGWIRPHLRLLNRYVRAKARG